MNFAPQKLRVKLKPNERGFYSGILQQLDPVNNSKIYAKNAGYFL